LLAATLAFAGTTFVRGKRIKNYFPPYMGVHTLPCVDDSSVYFVGVRGDLVVYRNGALEKFEVPGVKLNFLPKICAKKETVFLSLGLGRGFVAYSVETGEVKWKFTDDAVLSSPWVEGGKIYLVNSRGKVYVLNSETGKVLAEYDIGISYPVFTAYPVVREGRVYVGVDRWVFVLEESDEGGLRVVEKTHLSGLVKSPVLLFNGGYSVVVFNSSKGKKGYYSEYHFDDGSVKTVFLGVAEEYPGFSSADTDGARFVVGVGKKVAVLDRAGNVVWEKDYEDYVNLTVVDEGGLIGVAVGTSGYLYDDYGKIVCAVSSSDRLVAPPVVVGDRIIWADEYGNIWVGKGGNDDAVDGS